MSRATLPDNLEYRTTQQIGTKGANVAVDGKTLAGYAIVFDTPSLPIAKGNSYFREIIKRGATLQSLKSNDIFCLYSHSIENLLGRQSSGTLELNEDSVGLRFKLSVPNTSLGSDCRELVRRGDLKGMSFGFFCSQKDCDWSTDSNGVSIRTIRNLNLFEVSVVASPAYQGSSVMARAVIDRRTPLGVLMAKQELIENEIEWGHMLAAHENQLRRFNLCQ